MTGWTETRLGDVITLKRGYDLPKRERRDGDIPIISSSGLSGVHDEAKADPPGVVTGRYGTLGKVYFVDVPYWPLNTTLYVNDFKGSDERFVAYFLESMGLERYDGAAAVPGLDRNVLHRLEVRWPSPAIQVPIVALLAAYDELIENNLRRIEILEEMAQALYREWFVEFRFPGHEDVPLVDSPLGPVPDGWDVIEMSSFTKTQYGYTASTDQKPVGPRFLRGMDFNKRAWIDWSEVPYCSIEDADLAKYRVRVGDVLVIRMADPGKVAIVEKDVEAVYASYVVRVTPDPGRARPYWLFYYMSSSEYQGYISGAGTGTTRKSASAGVLTGSTLVLPPVAIQDQFVAVVSKLRQLLNNLIEQNTNLRSTRDLLLPKLVSGDIDVSGLDIETEWLVS